MERSRPIERLADALQGCLNEAAELGARKVKEELVQRLDRQDETLRLIWKQVKGSGRLPIDE